MDKMIEAFQGGKLQIDFISLTLVQNATNNPIEYRGTGYIRPTEDDTLTVSAVFGRNEKHGLRKETQ